MGKVIDSWLYALRLEEAIKQQKEKYAGNKVMEEVIDLLEIAKEMALEQTPAPALVLSNCEVRLLANDVMFYMEHIRNRNTMRDFGYRQRLGLLEKLLKFERTHHSAYIKEDKV